MSEDAKGLCFLPGVCDPLRGHRVFYVDKGVGDRVDQHTKAASPGASSTRRATGRMLHGCAYKARVQPPRRPPSSAPAPAVRTLFRPALEGLPGLVREIVFARYWTHEGEDIATSAHRAMMCAEVLVPDRVPPEYLSGAYVSCKASRDKFHAIVGDSRLPITIKPYLLFRS